MWAGPGRAGDGHGNLPSGVVSDLHAQRQGNLAFLELLLRVGGGAGNRESVGRPRHDGLDVVDQVVGHCIGAVVVFAAGGGIDRHEWQVEPAFDCPRVVELTALGGFGDVLPVVVKANGYIDMPVRDQVFPGELLGLAIELVGAGRQ